MSRQNNESSSQKTGDELKKEFEKLYERVSVLMPQLEEELIRKGELKLGEHITLGQAMRIIGEKQLSKPRAQPQELTRGLWLSSGDFIPQEKIPEYLLKSAESESCPAADAASSSSATTPGRFLISNLQRLQLFPRQIKNVLAFYNDGFVTAMSVLALKLILASLSKGCYKCLLNE